MLHGILPPPSVHAKVLAVGNPALTSMWARRLPSARIFAFRTLDRAAIANFNQSIDYLLWQEAPRDESDWGWVFPHIDRLLAPRGVALIHHPIRAGARMAELLQSIPPALVGALPQTGMNPLLQKLEQRGWRSQAVGAAKTLPELCELARAAGLHYLTESVSLRDFLPGLPAPWSGHEGIEQCHLHDLYTMRLWRDSIFLRAAPGKLSLGFAEQLRVRSRVQEIQESEHGFIYVTEDGLSLGLSQKKSLSGRLSTLASGELESLWKTLILSAAIDLERMTE